MTAIEPDLPQDAKNRTYAQDVRRRLEAEGIDLDITPTPVELAAAGAALRSGDRQAYEDVAERAKRAWARAAAASARSEQW